MDTSDVDVSEFPASFFEALHKVERSRGKGCLEKENRVPGGGASIAEPASRGVDRRPMSPLPSGDVSPGIARKRRIPPSLAVRPGDSSQNDPVVPDPGGAKTPLPDLAFDGEIVVAETPERVDALVMRIRRLCAVPGHDRAVGWDLEWVVNFGRGRERPVALMQVCVRPKPPARPLCALLRMCRVHGGLTPVLRAFVEDASIRKVGVQARGDAHKMKRDFGVDVGGVVELKEYAAARAASADTRPAAYSLAALAEWSLERRLPKKSSDRISDWEAATLSAEQIAYAALDAWASLRVFDALEERAPDASPPRPPPPPPPKPRASPPPSESEEEVDEDAPGWDAKDVIPALPAARQAPLMPAKTEAHRLHLELGWSGAQIAASKAVKTSTADNYLADAIRAGRAYRLGALGVTRKTMAMVKVAFERHRAEASERIPVAPPTGAGAERPLIRRVRELMLTPDAASYADVSFCLAHLERLELLWETRPRASAGGEEKSERGERTEGADGSVE